MNFDTSLTAGLAGIVCGATLRPEGKTLRRQVRNPAREEAETQIWVTSGM